MGRSCWTLSSKAPCRATNFAGQAVHRKAAERRRLGRELAERCRALANEADPGEAERRAFEEVLARGDVDPQAWPHVYQDFLDAFAPEQRRARGVYYTPAEVVRAQVRLVDDLLRWRLGCLRE